MAGLRLGGLASGMDTEAVITQILAVESQGKNKLTGRQWQVEARKAALDTIAIKLRGLRTAAEDLRSVGQWANVQKVSSADTSKLTARSTAGAAVGTFEVNVVQLARADQRFYELSGTDPGETSITINGVETKIPAGATKDQTAAAINANAQAPAYASIVDGRLVLSGKQTGVALNVTSSEWGEKTELARPAREAEYRIDNGATLYKSPSNTVTGLPGVEMTFAAVGATTVTVGPPGPDQDAIKAKAKAFVDTYNQTIDLVREKLTEERVKSPATKAEFGKGVLRGDSGLTAVMNSLRGAMGQIYEGDTTSAATKNPDAFNQLADIGIAVPSAQTSGTVSADRLQGKLVLDDAKLTAALATDPYAVRRLLGGVGAIDGFSQEVNRLVEPVARASDGVLASRASTADRELTRIREQSERIDARLKVTEARLRAQFSAMEKAMSASQSSSSWLSGQISGLPTWS